MKYKLIVDKQSKTNPSVDKREYEIDVEELRFKDDVADSLVITVEETYIMRRLSLSEYHVLSVLETPIKEPLGDLNVQLFEGENYIYLMDMTGNKFYAEYIVKNEFNNLYVTNVQMNSAINQSVKSIELSVSQKLMGYSTTTEMNATIDVKANEIKNSVKKTYSTKTETSEAKQEAINTADANTDEKLTNYSTTTEVESAIDQTARSLELSVDEKINSAIGTNYIKNGTFENNLENWTSDTSGSTTGSVTVQENSGTKYAQIISKGALTKLSQIIEGLKKDTEHTLIFNAYDNGDLEIDLEDGIFQVDIIQYKESSEEILEETSTRIYVSKESKTYEVKFTPTENIDVELIFSLKNPFVSNYSMSVMLTNIALCNGEVSEKFAKMQIESDIINLEVSKKVGNDEIISKINQSPEAVGIDANKIELSANDILNLLAGNTINLGSKNITISSDAFNVDQNGNVSIIDNTGTSGSFKIYSEGTEYETDVRSFGQQFHGPNGYVGIEADFAMSGGTIQVSTSQDDFDNCTFIQNGSIECVKVTQTSLAERKKNIEKLQDNAIDIIKNIDIYKYNLKSEKDTDKKHIGFVIGDDYKYSKEVTSLNNTGVDNYSFTSLCCKAIQELQEQIEQLQEKDALIQSLSERIKRLEAQNG